MVILQDGWLRIAMTERAEIRCPIGPNNFPNLFESISKTAFEAHPVDREHSSAVRNHVIVTSRSFFTFHLLFADTFEVTSVMAAKIVKRRHGFDL